LGEVGWGGPGHHGAIASGSASKRIRETEQATANLSESARDLEEASENFREALNACRYLDVPQAAGRSVKLRNLMATGEKPVLTVRRLRPTAPLERVEHSLHARDVKVGSCRILPLINLPQIDLRAQPDFVLHFLDLLRRRDHLRW
jgi:hypothetical protein